MVISKMAFSEIGYYDVSQEANYPYRWRYKWPRELKVQHTTFLAQGVLLLRLIGQTKGSYIRGNRNDDVIINCVLL